MRDTTTLPEANSFKSASTSVEAMAILATLAQRLTIGTGGLRDMQIEEVAESNLAILATLMQNTTNELNAWLAITNE